MRIRHYHLRNGLLVYVRVCASCQIVVIDLKFVCLLCVCLSLSMSTSTLNDIHHHHHHRCRYSCCHIFISCFFFPVSDNSNNFQHHFETFTYVIVKNSRNEKTALTRKKEIRACNFDVREWKKYYEFSSEIIIMCDNKVRYGIIRNSCGNTMLPVSTVSKVNKVIHFKCWTTKKNSSEMNKKRRIKKEREKNKKRDKNAAAKFQA